MLLTFGASYFNLLINVGARPDVVSNMRTIMALCAQDNIVGMFNQALRRPTRSGGIHGGTTANCDGGTTADCNGGATAKLPMASDGLLRG